MTITDDMIAPLLSHFRGTRLALFLESVEVIRSSVRQGAWVKRGAQRAGKGFNKGIARYKALHSPASSHDDTRRKALFRIYMASSYGAHLTTAELDVATDEDLAAIAPKVPTEVMRAWLSLMVALREIYADLDASRPAPVYTEIGLSPKVTATLQDANLDLDLTTRRLCPLGWRWGNVRDKDWKIVLGRDGEPVKVKVYFPKWPDDTVFGASRFSGCDCEACGKTIPSGLVVPILVSDKAGTPLGFWFGRDCARNILGIKDAGITR